MQYYINVVYQVYQRFQLTSSDTNEERFQLFGFYTVTTTPPTTTEYEVQFHKSLDTPPSPLFHSYNVLIPSALIYERNGYLHFSTDNFYSHTHRRAKGSIKHTASIPIAQLRLHYPIGGGNAIIQSRTSR